METTDSTETVNVTLAPPARENRFALDAWVRERRAEIEHTLERLLPAAPAADDPGRLVEAMRYSLLSPGKRLRPLLALAAAEAVGAPDAAPRAALLKAAAAVELVHCYSLVHDDLPAMDDDDLRRGRPTNHKVFGDAIAILAGDALLTLAFEWLAQAGAEAASAPHASVRFLEAISALARGAGWRGMVRGQARDLGETAPATLAGVEQLHAEKTGALFRAALEVGAVCGGASAAQKAALLTFGDRYGLAFQHADDLADAEHESFAAAARVRLRALTEDAVAALSGFDHHADALRGLARALGETS